MDFQNLIAGRQIKRQRTQVEISFWSEIATMRRIASRTSIPVPKIYASNVDAINHFGFRYILMEALEVRHLDCKINSQEALE